MWVRSEYAGELAVLATWLTALLPWSVSVIRGSLGDVTITQVRIRFVFFQLEYLFGISFGGIFKREVWGDVIQPVHQTPGDVPPGKWLWMGAAVLFGALLVLSVAYYTREDEVAERVPVDLVRLFGAALAVLAFLFSVATVAFARGFHRTVPIGVLFMWVFAVVLLRVERT